MCMCVSQVSGLHDGQRRSCGVERQNVQPERPSYKDSLHYGL